MPSSSGSAPRCALTEIELQDLAARFESATIPKAEWTHAAHLSVGLWHVDRYGPEEALARLRAGIRRLNDAHGTVNSTTGGYHETITRAYVVLFAELLAVDAPGMPLGEEAGGRSRGPSRHEGGSLEALLPGQALLPGGARDAGRSPTCAR